MATISQDKAILGARKHAALEGYEFLGMAGERLLACLDNDDIVFAEVTYGEGEFGEPTYKREDFERLAMSYVFNNKELVDKKIRFDTIGLAVTPEGDRAMVRHHVNCMEKD